MSRRATITLSKQPKRPGPTKPASPKHKHGKRDPAPENEIELKPDSLAFALLGAARAVARVKSGTALPQALAQVFSGQETTPQARGAIQDIAYRTMRSLGMAETLLAQLVSQAPQASLASLLCSAISLLLPVAEEGKRYEPFTVVDQAVTTASADPALAQAKGMVNAVLRRFLREREALLQMADSNPVAQWNYPAWWIEAMRAAWPHDWESILRSGNVPPPMTLRVNLGRISVADYLQRLAQAGMSGTTVGPSAVRLAQPVPVERIPGFSDGMVSVQDAAAQLAAPLLDLREGMRVLDACAAPGGKTGHILETARVDLLALDADPARLPRIEENLQRLRLSATVLTGDATESGWWDGRPFDRILADVPCTASGIVRRHPDIRWLRRKDDARRLATLSGRILDNLWQMLRPGGKLLFVTCSVWPQESEAQAAAFAARNLAVRLDAPGQLLPSAGADQDHDGLFYALFRKPAV